MPIAEMYKTHQRRIINYCAKFVGNKTVAEDLAQDTWVTYLEKHSDKNAPKLLTKIARDKCCDYLRRLDVRPEIKYLSEFPPDSI